MTVVLMPGARAVRRTDLIVAATAMVFVVLGLVAGVQLTGLAELGTSLQDAAAALDSTGRALGALGGLPIVGSQASGFADGVVRTAADVRSGGAQAAAAVRVLAVVVGMIIALLPCPVLAVYLPFRVHRRRALRALRQLVAADQGGAPALAAQLAHRAVFCLPYAQLRSVSPDPWADLASGRHRVLAAAELERLGLAPPLGWTTPLPQPPGQTGPVGHIEPTPNRL